MPLPELYVRDYSICFICARVDKGEESAPAFIGPCVVPENFGANVRVDGSKTR